MMDDVQCHSIVALLRMSGGYWGQMNMALNFNSSLYMLQLLSGCCEHFKGLGRVCEGQKRFGKFDPRHLTNQFLVCFFGAFLFRTHVNPKYVTISYNFLEPGLRCHRQKLWFKSHWYNRIFSELLKLSRCFVCFFVKELCCHHFCWDPEIVWNCHSLTTQQFFAQGQRHWRTPACCCQCRRRGADPGTPKMTTRFMRIRFISFILYISLWHIRNESKWYA